MSRPPDRLRPQPVTARLESCGDGDGAGDAGDVEPELAELPDVVPFDDEPEPEPAPLEDDEDEAPDEEEAPGEDGALALLVYEAPSAE